MSIFKATKKPVTIEAMLLTRENYRDVIDNFIGGGCNRMPEGINIKTLEGVLMASWGDYIIKGVKGEFYPCKPDIFEKTYDFGETSGTASALQQTGEIRFLPKTDKAEAFRILSVGVANILIPENKIEELLNAVFGVCQDMQEEHSHKYTPEELVFEQTMTTG